MITKTRNCHNKGNYAEITNICGVLCTWYNAIDDSQQKFEMNTSTTAYYSLNTYLCTLTNNCITDFDQSFSSSICFQPSIININKTVTLTEDCTQHLINMIPTEKIIRPEKIIRTEKISQTEKISGTEKVITIEQDLSEKKKNRHQSNE